MTDDLLVTVRKLAALPCPVCLGTGMHEGDEGQAVPCNYGGARALVNWDQLRALVARCEEAEAEITVMATGTSHDCDIIADGAAKEQALMDALVLAGERWDELNRQRADVEVALAALRARHAALLERAFREGFINFDGFGSSETDAAWLASEAKQGLKL